MSENSDQPVDPWAPPNQDGVELSKGATGGAAPGASGPTGTPGTPGAPGPSGAAGSPVHDQPTMASGVELPPPPAAPGTSGGSFGYPTQPAAPQPGLGAGPGMGAGTGYGYPAAPGYPAYGSGYGQPGWQQTPANGMGTAAMVLGIIAVAGFCFYGLGAVLGILALIFGIIGLKKANRGEATNRGMAIAGIVLGAVGTLVSAAFLGFIIWAVANDPDAFDDSEDPWATSLTVSSAPR
ncbi:DUF4190 domain-containing protein [Streptomyces sp. NPDC006339]|uniref:DUF4190 domain-containing protein n=1 Tax=Streptomyces sp. NPDC006339 TaxID=3156755 RepID=UPI0033B61B3E